MTTTPDVSLEHALVDLHKMLNLAMRQLDLLEQVGREVRRASPAPVGADTWAQVIDATVERLGGLVALVDSRTTATLTALLSEPVEAPHG